MYYKEKAPSAAKMMHLQWIGNILEILPHCPSIWIHQDFIYLPINTPANYLSVAGVCWHQLEELLSSILCGSLITLTGSDGISHYVMSTVKLLLSTGKILFIVRSESPHYSFIYFSFILNHFIFIFSSFFLLFYYFYLHHFVFLCLPVFGVSSF